MASRGPLLNSTFVILTFVALVLVTHASLHQVDAYDLDSNFTTCSVFKPIFHYVCDSYLRGEADRVPKCCCDLIKIVQSSIPDPESCKCIKDSLWDIVWYRWVQAVDIPKRCGINSKYVISRTSICPE
ncbi:Non-specific lipid-transfer protein 2-like protein [Drosera capensis]